MEINALSDVDGGGWVNDVENLVKISLVFDVIGNSCFANVCCC